MTLQVNQGFTQGEDITLVDTIYQSDGTTPQNITGWNLGLTVDNTPMKLTTGAGTILPTTPLSGICAATIARALTSSLNPGGYTYHIFRTDSGNWSELTNGAFVLFSESLLLTSVPVIKMALNIPQNDYSQDFDLMVKLGAADSAIKKWCKRQLVQKTLPPEFPKGSIQSQIVTRQRPLHVYSATGNITQNSGVITGVSDTSKLIAGMPCVIGATWSGNTPLQTGSTILSVDSSSQVTLANPLGTPVLQSGAGAPLVFGIAAWIDPQGQFGFGVGSGNGGPYNAGTELRIGIDYSPNINGSSGICENGVLTRLRGWAGTSSGGGFWDDAVFSGAVSGQRGTLTAARVPGWPSGVWGETKLVYTAGYNPIPLDLAQCCVEYVIALRRLTPLGGQWAGSVNYQGFSANLLAFSQDQKIADLRQKLSPYRELPV